MNTKTIRRRSIHGSITEREKTQGGPISTMPASLIDVAERRWVGDLILSSTSVGVDSNAVVVVPGSERSASKENARRAFIRATTQLQGRCGGRGRTSAECLLERRGHGCGYGEGNAFWGTGQCEKNVCFFVRITYNLSSTKRFVVDLQDVPLHAEVLPLR